MSQETKIVHVETARTGRDTLKLPFPVEGSKLELAVETARTGRDTLKQPGSSSAVRLLDVETARTGRDTLKQRSSSPRLLRLGDRLLKPLVQGGIH